MLLAVAALGFLIGFSVGALLSSPTPDPPLRVGRLDFIIGPISEQEAHGNPSAHR